MSLSLIVETRRIRLGKFCIILFMLELLANISTQLYSKYLNINPACSTVILSVSTESTIVCSFTQMHSLYAFNCILLLLVIVYSFISKSCDSLIIISISSVQINFLYSLQFIFMSTNIPCFYFFINKIKLWFVQHDEYKSKRVSRKYYHQCEVYPAIWVLQHS